MSFGLQKTNFCELGSNYFLYGSTGKMNPSERECVRMAAYFP